MRQKNTSRPDIVVLAGDAGDSGDTLNLKGKIVPKAWGQWGQNCPTTSKPTVHPAARRRQRPGDAVIAHALQVLAARLRKPGAALLAHNHPSGVAEPSHADELLTWRIKDALAFVDVRVVDHVIVAGAHTVSMDELGLMPRAPVSEKPPRRKRRHRGGAA